MLFGQIADKVSMIRSCDIGRLYNSVEDTELAEHHVAKAILKQRNPGALSAYIDYESEAMDNLYAQG